MSMFQSIMSKIFGHPAASVNAPPPLPEGTPLPANANPAADASKTPAANVDVGAVLTEMASKTPQPLNWQLSIVDLLKLVDLDSSLEARKTLATELHFTGDQSDTAGMNTWLHKAVMQKLADNGGRVPDTLRG